MNLKKNKTAAMAPTKNTKNTKNTKKNTKTKKLATPAEVSAYYRWLWERSGSPENKNHDHVRNTTVSAKTFAAYQRNSAARTVRNAYNASS